MKVFLSWSGMRSRHIADSLRAWLPRVLQSVKPWMSEQDIGSGGRWAASIASELADSRVGIICVTPENSASPWINFEAGALSKTLHDSRVCPYLIGMTKGDLTGPLSQFQASLIDHEGTKDIVRMLNEAIESPIPEGDLSETFEVWWPKLEEKFSTMPSADAPAALERSQGDILLEILQNTREARRFEEKRLELAREQDASFSKFHIDARQFFSATQTLMKRSGETLGALDRLRNVSGPEEFMNILRQEPALLSSISRTHMEASLQLPDFAGVMDNLEKMAEENRSFRETRLEGLRAETLPSVTLDNAIEDHNGNDSLPRR